MKKNWKDGAFFAVVLCVFAFLIIAICSSGCANQAEDSAKKEIKVYELIDKSTEVRTHRYWLIENAVQTDYILVWKSETGKTISCEAGRNSFYHYQKGKSYKFLIDNRWSEKTQVAAACRD